jgi:Prohead core protein serine protease
MDERLSLFVDCCNSNGFTLNLNESTTDKGLTRFKGKFQEAEAVNKNKRIYPFNVLSENVKKLLPIVKDRGLVGELDHPTDSIIHFEKCSHVITKLWWEGNNLMGEGEILNTPHGKILKSLLSDGVRVGISSRGVGNGRSDENGILVIGESYKLITFDAVADPSTFNAFQEKVVGKKESYVPTQNYDFNKNLAKNECSRINTVNKQALIACLGGIIEQQTSSIKAKLG